jgi:hypothetical protein
MSPGSMREFFRKSPPARFEQAKPHGQSDGDVMESALLRCILMVAAILLPYRLSLMQVRRANTNRALPPISDLDEE